MGLEFAIDELMSTGWSTLDTSGCEFHDGRMYPTVARVARDFEREGFDFAVKHIHPFDCFRAQWNGLSGDGGAVVGKTREEAAVYALARLRRSRAGAVATI